MNQSIENKNVIKVCNGSKDVEYMLQSLTAWLILYALIV
jgi:hypothetical protein